MSTITTVILTLVAVFAVVAILETWAVRNAAALRRRREQARAAAFYRVYEKREKVDIWA